MTASIDLIITNLIDNQNKSDSPEEYERSLKEAFGFLGFQAKMIGGKGDTDVLLTANIGKESYKVDVDGKTSKNNKILETQIDWLSLNDHKKKNNSNYIIVVGADFAGGNLERRAIEHQVSLLKTDELIKIIEAHSKYPFTLLEIKDLLSGYGLLNERLGDLLGQNQIRRDFIENFKIIIEEIERIQNTSIGYFTFESLAARDIIQDLEIDLEDIESVIQLLKISFINAIKLLMIENTYLHLRKMI